MRLILLVIFLVGSSAPQNADDILLLTMEAIAEGQNRIVQKLEDLQTDVSMLKESQKTLEENLGHLQSQMTGIQVQVEEVQKCATRHQVDAFKNTFVTEQEVVRSAFKQCSTREQIITFQDLLEADECEEGSHNCSSSATCKDSLLHYQCYCMPGYSGDGFTCEDVDECKDSNNFCGDEKICINYPGNYTCTCHEGYKEEGNSCQDEDECRQSINVCGDEQLCMNHPGNYSCICHEGYNMTEGKTCQDINECESGGHMCHANATCTNTNGSYICMCLPNLFGDGYTCSNECESPSHVIPGLGCVTPVEEEMTWDEAQNNCRSRGGQLLEGLRREHLEPLKQHFREYLKTSYAHIGLRGGVYVNSRDPVSSQDDLWGGGEPSGSDQDKNDCGMVFLSDYLMDYDCLNRDPSLCQHIY